MADKNRVPRKRFRPLIPCFRVSFPRTREIREMASVNPSSEKPTEKETAASSQAKGSEVQAAANPSSKKRVQTAEGKLSFQIMNFHN